MAGASAWPWARCVIRNLQSAGGTGTPMFRRPFPFGKIACCCIPIWAGCVARKQSSMLPSGGVGSEIQLSGRIWLIGETFGQNQGRPLYQAGLRYWIIRTGCRWIPLWATVLTIRRAMVSSVAPAVDRAVMFDNNRLCCQNWQSGR